jgi:hypothetical protein
VKRRLVVIMDSDDTIVGTQVLHDDPTLAGGMFARLVAGKGQKRHEIEIEMPSALVSREDVDRFHTNVKSHLR